MCENSQRSVFTICRKSTHFSLVRKYFFNAWLWEFLVELWTGNSDWTIDRPVISECFSCKLFQIVNIIPLHLNNSNRAIIKARIGSSPPGDHSRSQFTLYIWHKHNTHRLDIKAYSPFGDLSRSQSVHHTRRKPNTHPLEIRADLNPPATQGFNLILTPWRSEQISIHPLHRAWTLAEMSLLNCSTSVLAAFSSSTHCCSCLLVSAVTWLRLRVTSSFFTNVLYKYCAFHERKNWMAIINNSGTIVLRWTGENYASNTVKWHICVGVFWGHLCLSKTFPVV